LEQASQAFPLIKSPNVIQKEQNKTNKTVEAELIFKGQNFSKNHSG